jgi:hypothetical protein
VALRPGKLSGVINKQHLLTLEELFKSTGYDLMGRVTGLYWLPGWRSPCKYDDHEQTLEN